MWASTLASRDSLAGVADQAEFIEGDLFAADFRPANVVALFLGHRPNVDLRAALFRALRPGARIVSHQFNMGEWQPEKVLTVRTVHLGMWGEQWNPFQDNPRVPDYTGNESHFGISFQYFQGMTAQSQSAVYVYSIPTYIQIL